MPPYDLSSSYFLIAVIYMSPLVRIVSDVHLVCPIFCVPLSFCLRAVYFVVQVWVGSVIYFIVILFPFLTAIVRVLFFFLHFCCRVKMVSSDANQVNDSVTVFWF